MAEEPIQFDKNQLGDKRADQPWHRQERETEEEYALFELFLKLRDIRKVVCEFFHCELAGINNQPGYIYARSVKRNYAWDVRVKAYDRWVAKNSDDAVREMKRQQVREIGRKRMQLIRTVTSVAEKAIKPFVEEKTVPKLFEADLAVQIVQRLDKIWTAFEAANPLAEDENRPFQNEVESAKSKLLEFVDRREENLRKERERLEAKDSERMPPVPVEDSSAKELLQ